MFRPNVKNDSHCNACRVWICIINQASACVEFHVDHHILGSMFRRATQFIGIIIKHGQLFWTTNLIRHTQKSTVCMFSKWILFFLGKLPFTIDLLIAVGYIIFDLVCVYVCVYMRSVVFFFHAKICNLSKGLQKKHTTFIHLIWWSVDLISKLNSFKLPP